MLICIKEQKETNMNYLKIFFLTLTLQSIILFNQEDNASEYLAYTLLTPVSSSEEETPLPQKLLSEKTPTSDTVQEESIQTPTDNQRTELQQWDDHIAKPEWENDNKTPTQNWIDRSITLAVPIVKNNKELALKLKNDFLAAIKTNITDFDLFESLIKKFNAAIENELTAIPIEQTKETSPLEQPSAAADVFQGITPALELTQEPTPPSTETSISETTESSPSSTSETTASQEPSTDSPISQWKFLMSAIRKGEGDIDEIINNIQNLTPKLISSGEKTASSIKEEFQESLQLGWKQKMTPNELINIKDRFMQQLFPEEYAHNRYSDLQESPQYLIDEQKKQAEMAAQKAKKQEDQMQKLKVTLATAKQQGNMSEEKIQQLEEKMKLLETMADERQRLAAQADLKLTAETKIKKTTEKESFSQKIQQSTALAQKKAAEQKEQGIVSKAIQTAKDWWFGTGNIQTLEEQQEIKDLTQYLDSTAKNQKEKDTIIKLWQALQQNLHITPALLHKDNIDSWVKRIDGLLKELVVTYRIVSIKDALAKIKNAFIISSIDEDLSEKVIKSLEKNLEKEHAVYKREKEKINIKNREKKEQTFAKRQKQENIKKEEERIKEQNNKQLLTAASYKNEKQQWKEFLGQISHNKQATLEDNNTFTTQAIQKSESLFNLAKSIPAKKENSLAQKLKQKFTLALLEQQKVNDNKINVHRNMDEFNKAMNKLTE